MTPRYSAGALLEYRRISPMNRRRCSCLQRLPEGQATARAAAQQKFTDILRPARGSGAARAAAGDAATAARAAATAAPSIAPWWQSQGSYRGHWALRTSVPSAWVALLGQRSKATTSRRLQLIRTAPRSTWPRRPPRAPENSVLPPQALGLGPHPGSAVFPGIGTALGASRAVQRYFGGDAAIHGLRNVFGVTEDSPSTAWVTTSSVIRALGRATDGKGLTAPPQQPPLRLQLLRRRRASHPLSLSRLARRWGRRTTLALRGHWPAVAAWSSTLLRRMTRTVGSATT